MQTQNSTEENRSLYFAYGSNINHFVMERACPGAMPLGRADLMGWKLDFRYYADITKSRNPQNKVHGVVWSILPQHITALDKREMVPEVYEQKFVDLPGYGKCLTYSMIDKYKTYLEPPSVEYFTIIHHGYLQNKMEIENLTNSLTDTYLGAYSNYAKIQAIH
jgi:gamma-glutamylcyclotransferase (GGCT)/AIG2-like uncharacterized protein YtfP